MMPLEEKLIDQLKSIQAKLISEGKLPARAKLDSYYASFRARFGPDQLKNLDGEALLNAMHLRGTEDSLVYWLEFKNDEEFPAIFGSIAGGNALKFGLYWR